MALQYRGHIFLVELTNGGHPVEHVHRSVPGHPHLSDGDWGRAFRLNVK